MASFKELFENSETEFDKWWNSDPDVHHFDYVQDLIKDLGRDTISRYSSVFKAMDATMDKRQISMIMNDIKKMNTGKIVKY